MDATVTKYASLARLSLLGRRHGEGAVSSVS